MEKNQVMCLWALLGKVTKGGKEGKKGQEGKEWERGCAGKRGGRARGREGEIEN